MSLSPPIALRTAPRLALCLVLLCGLSLQPATGQDADPFYVGLLEEGIRAYQGGDSSLAAENLRIACFGLLDTPTLLARGLAYLSLAQVAMSNREGFEQSYHRLVMLEERFQGFSRAEIPEDARQLLAFAVREELSEAEAAESILFRGGQETEGG